MITETFFYFGGEWWWWVVSNFWFFKSLDNNKVYTLSVYVGEKDTSVTEIAQKGHFCQRAFKKGHFCHQKDTSVTLKDTSVTLKDTSVK